MSRLDISIAGGSAWVRPGDPVNGEVTWRLDDDAEALELRLFWFTEGKGTRDVEVVEELRIDAPGRDGRRSFSFATPEGPYSFSGTLITLRWALELVALPSEETARVGLVMAPTPVEVEIRSIESP